MVSPTPTLAVFGISRRTATTVSNAPDPNRNTGWDINPWNACDICVNTATAPGTPANLRNMAPYRRFADSSRRIVTNASLLLIFSPLPRLTLSGRPPKDDRAPTLPKANRSHGGQRHRSPDRSRG